MNTVELVAALAALNEKAQAQIVAAADYQRSANAAIAVLDQKPKRRGRGPGRPKAEPAASPVAKKRAKRASKADAAIRASFSDTDTE